MKKETFVSIINAMKEQASRDGINARLLHKILPDSTIVNTYCDRLTRAIIKALKSETNDEEDSWIEYYIYDLDFGRESDRLGAFDKDGVKIPLSTPEDLYDLLENNNKTTT